MTQLCAAHQIRNCCKYVVWNDRKAFCADLKEMYAAVNREAAEIALKKPDDRWGHNTDMLLNHGETTEIASPAIFDFPLEIRKLISATIQSKISIGESESIQKRKFNFPMTRKSSRRFI